MKIELLHVSALSDTLTEHPCKRQKERHNIFSTQIWTCIFYTVLYISWGSLPETWQEEGWNNTAFFSFQFTYIADSKKTGAFSVAPPWIWTDAERKCGHVNWYVLRSFKKNVVWGRTSASELHFKICLSLLYLLWHKLRTYFKTIEAQSIGFFTASVWLL